MKYRIVETETAAGQVMYALEVKRNWLAGWKDTGSVYPTIDAAIAAKRHLEGDVVVKRKPVK